MAKIFKRLSLTQTGFPLISTMAEQSIIINTADVTPDKDRFGKPQPIAMQNVLPTAQGYRSVVREIQNSLQHRDKPEDTEPISEAVVVPLRDSQDIVRLLYFSANGSAMLDGRRDQIHHIGDFNTTGRDVTYAYLKQQTYVFLKQIGCFIYDIGTDALKPQELKAIEPTAIHGMCAASGYLVLYDYTTIYYSSLVDPTDFYTEYEVDSGAGSIKPLYLKGPIKHCEPIEGGFLIYTTKNIVSAQYSGQISYPFVFREISNSSGVAEHCHVTPNTNNKTHYAWTEAGLLQVSNSAAQLIAPEITEFLQRLTVETWHIEPTSFSNEFQENKWGDDPNMKFHFYKATSYGVEPQSAATIVRLAYVGNRYLIVSYGQAAAKNGVVTPYQYALVFDEVLSRWGKLKFSHSFFFDNPITQNPVNIRFQDLKDAGTTYSKLQTDQTKFSDFYPVSITNQKQDKIIGYMALDRNASLIGSYAVSTTINFDDSTFTPPADGANFSGMRYVELGQEGSMMAYQELPFLLMGYFDINRDNSVDLTDIVVSSGIRHGEYPDDINKLTTQSLPFSVQAYPSLESIEMYAFNVNKDTQAVTMAGSANEYIIGFYGRFDLTAFSFGAKSGGKQSLILR